jgi:hypothetical protein
MKVRVVSFPNIIADIRQACCDSESVEDNSDSVGCGSKKCKRGCGGACDGVWRTPRLSGACGRAVGFVLVSLAGIWLQPR